MPTSRQLSGRYGALKMWGNVPDRTERTARMRKASPSDVEYWLNRLDPERFADATERQKLDAAEAAKRAHFAALAMKSAAARSRKSKTPTTK